MALIGIVQFAEKLLNQARENDQTLQHGSKQAAPTKASGNPEGDQFTPSAQNAGQEAGLFQVSNFSIFSAAADFILTEPEAAPATATGSNAAANGSNAQAAGTNGGAANAVTANVTTAQAANAATQATQRNIAAPAPVNTAALAATNAVAANTVTPAATNTVAAPATQNAAPSAAATANGAAANTAANAATNTTAAADAQTELQSLNATLAALGLTPDEITVIDRVAQLIKDFNPQAYTDIINQLEALAEAVAPPTYAQNSAQAATQNAATATNATQTATQAATATAANTPQAAAQTAAVAASGAIPTNAGFTIQELAIKFTGVEGNISQTARHGRNAGGTQFSAFNLQIEEVQITLANGAGQTAQIQAPQAATTAASAQAQAQTKTAGA